MNATGTSTQRDAELVQAILERASSDLAMIIDREVTVRSVACERANERIAAEGSIHISFRLEFRVGAEVLEGCLLVPLREAICIACYLMVMPDEIVRSRREETELDRTTKDAMLEVSNFIGGSADQVLRGSKHDTEVAARSAGCQGVADGAVPNFKYARGSELVIARLELALHDLPPFDAVMMLPAALVDA